jgi:hypothetical protein
VSDKGSTLVLNLLVMSVFCMMAVIVYKSANAMVVEAVYYERSTQALAIAEAGLQDAMHSLYQDSTWRTGFNQKAFAGGYYTVTVSTSAGVVVASTGYSASILLTGRAVKTVTVPVVFVSTSVNGNAVLANALIVNGTVDAYDPSISLTPPPGSFVQGGTVWSNAGINTSAGSCPPLRILSDVVYFQSAAAPAGACVSGTISPSTYTLALPYTSCGTCVTVNNNAVGINPSSAWSIPSKKLTINSGETVTLSSGTYYFKQIFLDGTLNVDTTSGPVKIFYDNQFRETAGCALNNLSLIPSRLLIADTISGAHTVDLNCTAPLHAYLEGAAARFDLNSPQQVYGHITAEQITIDAGAKLHFDLASGAPVTHVGWTTGPAGSWIESYKRQ